MKPSPPTHTHKQNSNALFSELEHELRQRFDVTTEDEAAIRAEVIDGRLGGLEAWAVGARTRDVVVE
jgi:hypothetical protein